MSLNVENPDAAEKTLTTLIRRFFDKLFKINDSKDFLLDLEAILNQLVTTKQSKDSKTGKEDRTYSMVVPADLHVTSEFIGHNREKWGKA